MYEADQDHVREPGGAGHFHAKFQLVSAEKAAENGSVPMHPGAEKYYKEIGLL